MFCVNIATVNNHETCDKIKKNTKIIQNKRKKKNKRVTFDKVNKKVANKLAIKKMTQRCE